jgi:hypothetical protein
MLKPIEEPPACSICCGPLEPDPEKAKIWAHGNNAQPVNDGRCCDRCDWLVVIPARLRLPVGSLGSYEDHAALVKQARAQLEGMEDN